MDKQIYIKYHLQHSIFSTTFLYFLNSWAKHGYLQTIEYKCTEARAIF